MGKKKIGIIVGLIVVAALAFVALFWNQGAAERSQDKLDLAVKYLSENKYEQAILAYNEAISIDPKEVKAYEGLAKVYTLQGKYEDAKAAYNLGIDAVDPESQIILQLGLGGMYIDQGKIDEAEKAFKGIKDKNTKCLEAYWGLAMVCQEKGDTAGAEAMLRQAVEANPNEYRAYNALALYLKQKGQEEEAFGSLLKSISLEINQQEAYLVLSDLYRNRWYELTTKAGTIADPKTSAMLEFFSYYGSEDYSAAVRCYNEKLIQQQDNVKARILTATAMIKTGDMSGAEDLMEAVLSKEIDNWLQSDIARYYLAAGDKEKAKAAAIEALHANPTNLDAVSMLQTIGTNDESGKLYAAEYLLYSWKPVKEVKLNLAAADIKLSLMTPEAGLISFIRKNYPDALGDASLGFQQTVVDITGDGSDEIILGGDALYNRIFVLQPQGDGYKVLFTNGPERNFIYGTPEIDKYGDLILSFVTGGTRTTIIDCSIFRWDGQNLQEIWKGYTKHQEYLSVEMTTEENATFQITGTEKPQKLKYVIHGRETGRKFETVTEYRFDEDQFKFIEVSSKTNETITDEKLALLKAAADWCTKNSNQTSVVMEPPYGSPQADQAAVGICEMNGDQAQVWFGVYCSEPWSIISFQKNSSGKWQYLKGEAVPPVN